MNGMSGGLIRAAEILDRIREAEIASRAEKALPGHPDVPITPQEGTASAARVTILEVAAAILRDEASK